MNMDKVGEEFNIVNVLIYLVLYMVIVGFFIGFYTIPLIKTFKTSQSEYRNDLRHYKSLLSRHEYLKNSFEKKKNSNIKIIKKFRNKFNEKDFYSFGLKYFESMDLKKNGIEMFDNKKEKFSVNKYKMHFSFKDMEKFYSFIDDLKTYSSVVKIDFPVILEKRDTDKYIKGIWNLKIYETNGSI